MIILDHSFIINYQNLNIVDINRKLCTDHIGLTPKSYHLYNFIFYQLLNFIKIGLWLIKSLSGH